MIPGDRSIDLPLINGLKIPFLQELKIEKATGTIELVGDFPIDTSKGPLATKMSARFNFKASGKPSASVPFMRVSIRIERDTETTFTYQ